MFIYGTAGFLEMESGDFSFVVLWVENCSLGMLWGKYC